MIRQSNITRLLLRYTRFSGASATDAAASIDAPFTHPDWIFE